MGKNAIYMLYNSYDMTSYSEKLLECKLYVFKAKNVPCFSLFLKLFSEIIKK